jgi:aspartokinase
MTEADLKTFIDRFATLAPSSRASEKRRLLETNGDAILALHRRGHSWSSIARELSAATGERVSADLLRAACAKRAPQRRARSVKGASATTALKPAATATPVTQPSPASSSERFGAKGLKL